MFSSRLENFLQFSSNLKHVVRKLFEFGRVKKLPFGKGLNVKPGGLGRYLQSKESWDCEFAFRLGLTSPPPPPPIPIIIENNSNAVRSISEDTKALNYLC